MFPLVPILGLSPWRGDGMARANALPFVLAGLALGRLSLNSLMAEVRDAVENS
jgi:hypothetical protein